MAGGARGCVGGAWRQDAKRWLNRGCAGRSRGVLAEPVALQPLEVAQRRRSQRQGQKAPSTTRCIKTCLRTLCWFPTHRGQKAPSTTRCIKTQAQTRSVPSRQVRKHPAPEGALIHSVAWGPGAPRSVRKHPAPEGALRPDFKSATYAISHQKAPSTTRCIKTLRHLSELIEFIVRKHPAPQGALRRNTVTLMTLNPDDRRHLAHQRGASRPSPVGHLAHSSPWKWRNDAAPRGRGQKAPSTTR